MPISTPFEVKPLKGGRIHAISFSLDSTRPEEYYEGLERTLARLRIDGEVLLDLLACNGQTSRRFFIVHFDGKHLAFDTLRVAREEALDASLLHACSSFYLKNCARLKGSVLSAPAIRRLKISSH